jgi:Zn-dependent protease
LDYQGLLIFAPVLLFSVIAHEYAHGYAALKQGDDTALVLGRLTWNPIKHIDPFMTIILPIVLWLLPGDMILAGAKPVPVNPANYRNYRRGDIIVSLAGVATNLLIAVGCALLFPLFGVIGRSVPALESSAAMLQAMMLHGLFLNLILIFFNLIPIPPLDGSHVLKHFLPAAIAYRYQQVARYGILVLLATMMIAPGTLNVLMTPAFRTFGWTFTQIEGTMLPDARGWMSR